VKIRVGPHILAGAAVGVQAGREVKIGVEAVAGVGAGVDAGVKAKVDIQSAMPAVLR